MKKIFFFCLCSFLTYQLLAQPFQKKQITNFDYDSRGAAFPTYPYGFSFLSNPPIFYEAHNGNSVNIMMMSYNPYSDSFYNPLPITDNNFKNINPISSFTDWYPNNKINLIWQTNENGNWDLAIRTFTDSGWSNKKFIANSPEDEINPKDVLLYYWGISNDCEIEILYERENSIYLYQQKDSLVNHEIVFQGNDSLSFTHSTGVNYWGDPLTLPSGLYIAATCKAIDGSAKIVYRYKIYLDSTWSPIYTAYDSSFAKNPIFFFTHPSYPKLAFEKRKDGKEQIYIIPEMNYLGQNQYAVSLIDDSSVSTSDLISFSYAYITNKNVSKNFSTNLDFPIYSPHTFRLIRNDSVFAVSSPYFLFGDALLYYTNVRNSRITVGNLGVAQNFNAVAYTVWEDSSNGRINLFGVRRLDPIGDIRDEIIISNFILYQNYPNPFNPKTIIKYNLLSRDYVTLKIFDVLGNEVAILVNEEKDAGEYKTVFDASAANGLASGLYIYRLTVGKNNLSRKMILLK